MADNLSVVIAAAGVGRRMGSGTNKQYMLLNSRPVLAYSLDVFAGFDPVKEIIVVANSREINFCKEEVINKYGYQKISRVIGGGKERQDSVWIGLSWLDGSTDFVAVHDGARPLLSPSLLEELFRAAQKWGAAVPGIPVRDTLKMIDEEGFISQTLDRHSIIAVQTPQVFRYSKLVEAYKKAYEEGFTGTDDASLFERYIGRVKMVPGDHKNIKITFPEDLIAARSLLEAGAGNEGRVREQE
ncbi:MAG: 2-C-methyl-D-erythritol 4-phosphate cytidylyltransferase [Syntrophomonadaceae bacterium]|nr:2-C-methyl-D-erythritol 4-phosphate cytidylyltransferase [Syntrophomonadaceae bacterium]